MFSLGIHYLMGWAMAAADGAKKEVAEWPPHPDRVFMALAAAWFETGEDPVEGAALRWLETLPAPSLATSESRQRQVVTHFVPVNDTRISLAHLPEFRSRQPRSFPVTIPRDPTVHLIWAASPPDDFRPALSALCSKVGAIGHSASLVQMWLEGNPPNANLEPRTGVARHRMRVPGPGRLDYLAARFGRKAVIAYCDLDEQIKNSKGKAKKMLQERLKTEFPAGRPASLRPEPGTWLGYDSVATPKTLAPRGSVFDPQLVILTLHGKRLSLPASLKLTEALRGALLAGRQAPVPEWLSGHAPDGSASRLPHIALVPLPFVDAPHADGRLMGVALALPRDLDPAEVGTVLEAWLRNEDGLPRRTRLFNGQWLECAVELETRETPPVNLQAETWTTPSRHWATVTPVVLDRHFKGADKWDRAAESVKDACERIGLPRPSEVLLHPVSLCAGVPKSGDFPALARKRDGGPMQHSHATLIFPEAVGGPVLIGAGRFRGYGLCRPIQAGGGGHD